MTIVDVIHRWHHTVNSADLPAAARVVTDPIVVAGPSGAASITPKQFQDWVRRSGITPRPRTWHPVSTELMVVEQDANWPRDSVSTAVATVFRVSDDRVSAALRASHLEAALWLAGVCREMGVAA